MGTNNSRPRIATPLVEETDNRLQAYALVAAAAGVGLLALAQEGHAQVIYRQPGVSKSQTFDLDLNNDGIVDFTLCNSFFKSVWDPYDFVLSRRLTLGGNAGAGVVGTHNRATVLLDGSTIGSSRGFLDVNAQHVGMVRDVWDGCGSSCSFLHGYGNWQSVQDGYLGLKFEINGETHYGWARLNVSSQERPPVIRAKVTGFAYETIPNQPIIAGQPGTAAPGKSLGQLSRGSEGH